MGLQDLTTVCLCLVGDRLGKKGVPRIVLKVLRSILGDQNVQVLPKGGCSSGGFYCVFGVVRQQHPSVPGHAPTKGSLYVYVRVGHLRAHSSWGQRPEAEGDVNIHGLTQHGGGYTAEGQLARDAATGGLQVL